MKEEDPDRGNQRMGAWLWHSQAFFVFAGSIKPKSPKLFLLWLYKFINLFFFSFSILSVLAFNFQSDRCILDLWNIEAATFDQSDLATNTYFQTQWIYAKSCDHAGDFALHAPKDWSQDVLNFNQLDSKGLLPTAQAPRDTPEGLLTVPQTVRAFLTSKHGPTRFLLLETLVAHTAHTGTCYCCWSAHI